MIILLLTSFNLHGHRRDGLTPSLKKTGLQLARQSARHSPETLTWIGNAPLWDEMIALAIKPPTERMILRATQGMLSSNNLVLPQDSVKELQKALPQSTVKDVEGTNHYTMIFQPHEVRDKAVLDFLEGLPRYEF